MKELNIEQGTPILDFRRYKVDKFDLEERLITFSVLIIEI